MRNAKTILMSSIAFCALAQTPAGQAGTILRMDGMLLLGFGPRTPAAATLLHDAGGAGRAGGVGRGDRFGTAMPSEVVHGCDVVRRTVR